MSDQCEQAEAPTVEPGLELAPVPEEWAKDEPAYVRWATAVADVPTWEKVPAPDEQDGPIFASLYREQVIGEPPPLPPAQPARPDLRKLTCLVCGAPASPHRVGHAPRVIVPAREPKVLP